VRIEFQDNLPLLTVRRRTGAVESNKISPCSRNLKLCLSILRPIMFIRLIEEIISVSRLSRLSAAFCLVMLMTGLAGAAQQEAGPTKPAAPLFHGHWCGMGDIDRALPVDAFDAACRAHDLCYEKVGRNACICDQAFLKSTAGLIKNPRTEESIRSKAATANSLFSAAPCVDPEKDGQSARTR
jgi:hypothetical protein